MYKDSEAGGMAVTLSVKNEKMSTLSCKDKGISFKVRFGFILILVILIDKIIKFRCSQTNLLSRAQKNRDNH